MNWDGLHATWLPVTYDEMNYIQNGYGGREGQQ